MEILAAVIPLAIVVGVSPIPIMPAVLLLMSERSRANSLAYIGGWLTTLTLLVLVALGVTGLIATTSDSTDQIGWVETITGAVFLVLAVVKWLQARSKSSPGLPSWMAALNSYAPRQSVRLGILLAGANPKNLAMALAAGAEIAVFTSAGSTALSVVLFVVVGSIGVLFPFVLQLVLGARAGSVLSTCRRWLETHGTTLSIVILLVLGVLLLLKGLS